MAFMKHAQRTGGDGEYLPRLDIDARNGIISKVVRTQQPDGNWINAKNPVAYPFKLLVDFANLEIGQMCLDRAVGVDVRFVKYRDIEDGTAEPIAPPTEHHKECFRVRIFSTKIDGGVHEFASSANCVRSAMDLLHDDYLAEAAAHEDQCPIVEFSGQAPKQTARGTNYYPIMKIVGWSDRKPFDQRDAAPAAPPPAPAPEPAPSAVTSVESEF